MKRILASIFLALFLVTPVFAVEYTGTITYAEQSGNAYAQLAAFTPFPTTNLITDGFISATGLDTALYSGATPVKHLLTTDKLLFAYPLTAHGTNSLVFYTDQTPASAMPVIVGYGGYITRADVAAMELGNNFESEFSGWIDTSVGTDKNLIYKQNAFRTYISGAGVVTSNIATVTAGATVDIRPNADQVVGSNMPTVTGAATFWEALDDPVATPDDAATTVSVSSLAAQRYAQVKLENPVYLGTWPTIINSVTVYFRVSNDGGGGNIHATPFIYLSGVTTEGADQAQLSPFATYSQTLARPSGGTWTMTDIDNLEVGIRLTDNGANTAYCTQLYVRVNYDYAVDGATVTHALTSGFHNIMVTATGGGGDLLLYIDNVLEDSVALAGDSVPDNANSWIINQNNAMPYFDYYYHTVNGTLIVQYEPQTIISGNTLPDLEGAAQNGTITWGANPTGVQVNVSGLVPTGVDSGQSTELVPADAMGEITTPEAPEDTALEGVAVTWFQPTARNLADMVNLPITMIWLFFMIASILLWIKGVFTFMPHTGFAMFGIIIIVGGHLALSLMPFFVIFIPVSVGLLMLTMERSPNL